MANQPFGSESSKKSRSLREFMDENNGRAPGMSSSVPKEDSWGEDAAGKAADLDATSDQEHEEIMRRLRSQQGIEQRVPRRGRDDEEEETERARLKMKKESPLKSDAPS